MNEFSYHILPIIHAHDAGISRLWSYASLWSYGRLRSEDATPVVCPTPVERHDSDCISWLRLTSQLRSYLPTPVAHHGSGRWACCMSYHLSCERICMIGLDDCSILQPEHLVRSRLGETHDSFSVQNLNISWLLMFNYQAMCHVTDRHLA
jgi:hypothetical protein